MAASATDKFKKVANNFASTTTSGIVGAGDTSVTLSSVTNLATDTAIDMVIDRVDATGAKTPAKREYVKGIISGSQITNLVRGIGNSTAQAHIAGSVIEQVWDQNTWNDAVDGILVNHDQSGNHKSLTDTNGNSIVALSPTSSAVNQVTVANASTGSGPTISATGTDANVNLNLTPKGTGIVNVTGGLSLAGPYSGWSALTGVAPTTVTANGNRSYDITFSSSIASILSPGMRLQTTRTVAGQQYMGGLMNGSSHYFTKVTATGTLATVTDNFTLMAYVQPTAYQLAVIMGRADSTPNNHLDIEMNTDGTISVVIRNGGTANYRSVQTQQSLALNKKTHVAATWASGTVLVYFDGISVPVKTATTGGTAPTTAGTGGDFSIGRNGAYNSSYFAGYISNVGVFNAVLTAATIRQYATSKLLGTETNCIGAWSLDNVATDATATNNLTATGGVGFSSSFSPMGNNGVNSNIDYGIVMAVSGSTATVQVPEGCTIPTSGGVSAVSYSTVKAPYGMPVQRIRWLVETIMINRISNSGAAAGVWQNLGWQISVPTGEWNAQYYAHGIATTAAVTAFLSYQVVLSTSSSSSTLIESFSNSAATQGSYTQMEGDVSKTFSLSLSSQTIYYLLINGQGGTTNGLYLGSAGTTSLYFIRMECAYL